MRLNEITDRPGATRDRKRVGRGIGSGLGKTSGKGQKGQKARAGVAIKGFEGGQMPLHRRLPKRGFNNVFAKKYNEINLGTVQKAIDDGKLDGKGPIPADALLAAGLIRRKHHGVRLLGTGEITAKLAFEVTGASQSAIKAVEAKGGSVTLAALPYASGKAIAVVPEKPKKLRGLKAKAAEAEAAQTAKAEKAAAKAAAAGPAAEAAEPEAAKPKREAKASKDEAGASKAAKADQGEAKKPRAKPAKKDK